jgi:hypothetical protein
MTPAKKVKWLKWGLQAIVLILFILGLVFCLTFGDGVKLERQLELFGALRDFSAVIFAVVGIWMALICPDAVKKVYANKDSDHQRQLRRLKFLIFPLVLSAICIFIAMSVEVFASALPSIQFFREHADLLKRTSYAGIFALCFLEIWSLLQALVPAIFITDDIQKAVDQRKASDQITPNSLKRKQGNR